MRRWAEVAEAVASTTRTSEKAALIADHLRALDETSLPIACVFFTGRPFAQSDQRSMGLGWSAVRSAVVAVAGVDDEALGRAYDRYSDLGLAVADVLEAAGRTGSSDDNPTLGEVAGTFADIEGARGAAAKSAAFAELVRRCDPLTAKYVTRIVSGDLRIGLREGLLEAAIARAFERPLADVKRAGMLTGDIGRTAAMAREGRLTEAELALNNPFKFMLASPAEDAAEIVARLGPVVWVEDKYDGIRCQLHKRGSDVRLYSRDLHDVSAAFPEVVEEAARLEWDGILDGEILGWRDGVVLPFLALQARLGRKAPSVAIRTEVPVIFVAFDLLARGDGGDAPVRPLLEEPLSTRRRYLEGLHLPLAADGGRFALSHLTTADSADALEAAFGDARARRNEGLMVKDPDSPYSPGRRGMGWLKMKKALATLDCVVVGVEVGHGKRHGVLSDYTFAVRDDETGELVTIGKAYSGLTDAEIAEMTRFFGSHTIRRFGRYHQVEPVVVVEIAFDVIMRSARHKSGFALRFPRIVRLRPDKDPSEIDTLAAVEAIFRGLQAGAEHLVTAAARSPVSTPD
jgi:DNA ligase-1